MEVSTIFEILGFVFGSGIIVKIITMARKSGETDHVIKGLETDVKGLKEKPVVGVSIYDVDARLTIVKEELSTKISDEASGIHERVSQSNRQISDLRQEMGAIAEAIRAMRKDWDGLQVEIRQLLRSDASVSTDLANLKERVKIFEERLSEVSDRTSALQSSVADLQRRRDRG